MTKAPLPFSDLAASDGHLDHTAFDDLLGRYVKADRSSVSWVDYTAWRASSADRSALDDYLVVLQAVHPASLTRDEQFAFWVNLYNAETLRVVLAHRPTRSILFIRPTWLSLGPWSARRLTVDGVPLSLSDIENRILRPGFADARVHYALNCASTGCPTLRPRAWVALNLDAELDAAARAMINRPDHVRIKNGKVVLSRIFKWYRQDFGQTDAEVIDHIATYADDVLKDEIARHGQIAGYQYDWSLNGNGKGPD